MSIFGQVWLWSAAAFVVGVLLTWLFLARPAQARSRHLERRLLAAQSAPAQPTRAVERDPVSAPIARKEPITGEAPSATEERHAAPSWLERDSLAGRSPGYQPGSEIDDDSLFEPEDPEYPAVREPQAEATTVFGAFGREPDDGAAERGALYVGDHAQGAEPGETGFSREQVAGYGRDESERDQAAASEAVEQGRGSLFERGEQGRAELVERDEAGFGRAAGLDQAGEDQAGSAYARGQADGGAGHGRGALFEEDPAAAGRGSLFEPDDQAGRGGLFGPGTESESAAAHGGLFEQAGPESEGAAGRGSLFERAGSGFEGRHSAEEPAAGPGSLFGRDAAPEPERGSLFDPDHAPEPQRAEESGSPFTPFAAEPEPPAYAFGGDEPDQPAEEGAAATESTQILPKRQPRRSAHAFDPPQPVQPSMRTVERRDPIRPGEGGRSGSLFEPTPRAHGDSSVPPGPFGPGSAMPRPGGGKPSEEFTVKASVTALRYCTEDSPQYGRMIAEVWFRTADDAERVGFRPL